MERNITLKPPKPSHLLSLPRELFDQIIGNIRYEKKRYLRGLRTVCRLFNEAMMPFVLNHVQIIMTGKILSTEHQEFVDLHILPDDISKVYGLQRWLECEPTHLRYVNRFTIKSLEDKKLTISGPNSLGNGLKWAYQERTKTTQQLLTLLSRLQHNKLTSFRLSTEINIEPEVILKIAKLCWGLEGLALTKPSASTGPIIQSLALSPPIKMLSLSQVFETEQISAAKKILDLCISNPCCEHLQIGCRMDLDSSNTLGVKPQNNILEKLSLNQFQNLKSLDVFRMRIVDDVFEKYLGIAIEPLSLPNLTSLKIVYCDWKNLLDCLSKSNLPKLRKFSICTNGFYYEGRQTIVLPPVGRSLYRFLNSRSNLTNIYLNIFQDDTFWSDQENPFSEAIVKHGSTLQVMYLRCTSKFSFGSEDYCLDATPFAISAIDEIIRCCPELREFGGSFSPDVVISDSMKKLKKLEFLFLSDNSGYNYSRRASNDWQKWQDENGTNSYKLLRRLAVNLTQPKIRYLACGIAFFPSCFVEVFRVIQNDLTPGMTRVSIERLQEEEVIEVYDEFELEPYKCMDLFNGTIRDEL